MAFSAAVCVLLLKRKTWKTTCNLPINITRHLIFLATHHNFSSDGSCSRTDFLLTSLVELRQNYLNRNRLMAVFSFLGARKQMKTRRSNQYKPGDHLAICDRCGFTLWASEMKKTWDGLLVCPEDWEPRHPQDFVRGKDDKQSVTDPNPYPEDVFITALITGDDL